MKWKGRPQSSNVLDYRSYFGSEAFDPDYPEEDRVADFIRQSLLQQIESNPQPLETGKLDYVKSIIDWYERSEFPNIGMYDDPTAVASGFLPDD